MPTFRTAIHRGGKFSFMQPGFFASNEDLYDFEYESELKTNIERCGSVSYQDADFPSSSGSMGPCRHQAMAPVKTVTGVDWQKFSAQEADARKREKFERINQQLRDEKNAKLQSAFHPYVTLAFDKETGKPCVISTWDEHLAFMKRNEYEYI